jgi:hypothetical protein
VTANGPYADETEAAAEPMPRAIRDLHRAGRVRSGDPERIVSTAVMGFVADAMAAAGVELGDYDRRILAGLARGEQAAAQVIIGLITRAYESGRAAGVADGGPVFTEADFEPTAEDVARWAGRMARQHTGRDADALARVAMIAADSLAYRLASGNRSETARLVRDLRAADLAASDRVRQLADAVQPDPFAVFALADDDALGMPPADYQPTETAAARDETPEFDDDPDDDPPMPAPVRFGDLLDEFAPPGDPEQEPAPTDAELAWARAHLAENGGARVWAGFNPADYPLPLYRRTLRHNLALRAVAREQVAE